MEAVKDIRNDALVRAYHTMDQNNTTETQNAVTREMVKATFLLPVNVIRNKMPEDFPPKLLNDNKGRFYLPLFTDQQQAEKMNPELAAALLPVDISDAFGYLVDSPKLAGVILNAADRPNLICARPLVESIAKLWSRVKTAELNGEDPESAFRPVQKNKSIKLMVPKVYPEGLADALADALASETDIRRIWMCRVQDDPQKTEDQCDWMIIIDAENPLKGREETFKTAGAALAKLLHTKNIIFTDVTDNIRPLTKQAPPIYTRPVEA